MNCPRCHAAILPIDLFCEECGTSLKTSSDAIANTNEKFCQKCGATANAIDAEGYCANCGFRNPTAADYLEITITPTLAGVSDRGLKHHCNEDFLALNYISSTDTAILVVCDGVSSSQTPEQAAQVAATTACETLTTGESTLPPEVVLQQAIKNALEAISTLPYTPAPDADPPSTTLIAALVKQGIATIAWLGDSRAYWISDQESRLLTQDHSWLNEVVASGEMTEAQALQAPQAHAITRWLGVDAPAEMLPSLVSFPISGSGYLLLCSDGLWNYAPAAEQLAELMQLLMNTDTLNLCRHLVNFARSQGGRDNITTALLSVQPLHSEIEMT
jgi:serine/threonine protein phosphatase PrpC